MQKHLNRYVYHIIKMETDSLKGQLINHYLTHQLREVDYGGEEGGSSSAPANQLQSVDLPDNAVLEEFKNQVRVWIDLDNTIRKLKQATSERNVLKKQLTEKILRFMSKYNIEDLNTKDGSKLRYKVSHVKPTVSKADIKERLVANYGKVDNLDELTKIVFDVATEQRVEKVSLRRFNAPANAGAAQS